MKYQRILITALISLSTILSMQHVTAATDTPLQKQIKVEFASTDELAQLRSLDMDIWKIYADHIIAAVDYDKVAEIEGLGFTVEVISDDAWNVLDPQGAPPSKGTFGSYHTYAEVESILRAMESSGAAKVYDIGDSVEGRDIWAIRISDNPTVDEDEPSVLFVGCHHAREWISVEVSLYIAKYLTDNYATDPEIQSMVDNQEIWIVPVLNPDGYEYTRTTNRGWRKNRRNNGGSYGVDLNRNYGYNWGYDNNGSSGNPGDNDYRGPSAFSEPETQALRDLCLAHEFRSMITYHSYGGEVACTWGYTFDPSLDFCRDRQIANVMESLMNEVNGAGYTSPNTYPYLTNGDTTDWTYGNFRIPSFTIELRPTGTSGGSGFELPENEIIPTCEENLPAALYLIGWNQADLNNDYIVSLADLAILSSNWLGSGCNMGNLCCDWADIFGSGTVDMEDMAVFSGEWGMQSITDSFAPSPDPMSFSSVPTSTGDSSIAMTASLATDFSGVEYYFTCTAGGGNDSGWQVNRTYVDTGLTPETQYTYTVKARDTSGNYNETDASTALPATTTSTVAYNVYYGQLHSHTSISDGSGSPAQAYQYARDTAQLDFFSISDHDYYPDDMTASDWTTIKNAANSYNDDGTFVAFWGFEWSSDTTEWQPNGLAQGHITIINSDDFCISSYEPTRTLDQLATWLDARDVAAFFNHPGQYGTNFDNFNFNYSEKIVGMELWNRNDDYYGSGSWYHSALNEGFYIGASGSQDNHSQGWGTTNEWRLAVLAPSKTRASIFDALKARRFYSSRDQNLVLSFTCDDSQMGSKINGGVLDVVIEASDGDSEIFSQIDLLENGIVIETWTPDTTDPYVSTTVNGNQGDYFYVRVYQSGESGWRAISSPIFITSSAADVTSPTPDPMTFSSFPAATGDSSVAMTASLATDFSSVEYFFTCTGGGGNDSGWQDSTSYTDIGLTPDTQYTYTVTARDKSTNQNETAASDPASATTDSPDLAAPDPSPMTWDPAGNSTTLTSISMTATTATDDSGVEYYFECTAGGGNDSGWQDSTAYIDIGLTPETLYTYTVTARDKSVNQNPTLPSSAYSVTTLAVPVGPAVWTDKAVYAPGEQIVVNFANADGNQTDWVGLYVAGAANNDYYDWLYTDGTQSGTAGIYDSTVNFNGLSAGSYQARFFFNDNYTLQASYDFTVE